MKRFIDTAVLVGCMLIFGTVNTVFFKLMFQIDCPTLPSGSRPVPFDKPWFTNMEMFLAETSLLVVFYVGQARKQKKHAVSGLVQPAVKGPPAYYFLLPACCDVMGTGISSVAMMLIEAAVWQMMRGAIIVFTAIFAVIFLKRKLVAHHWIGVITTVVGLCFVGFAAIMETPPGKAGQSQHTGYGVGLVLLAQVFSAFQCTYEEYLLTGLEVSATQTVGMEGAWGVVIMVGILSAMTLIPGNDHGSYESLPDGIYMMSGSKFMQGITSTYMVSIALYNFVGMKLCRKLSAVTRCLVDCLRTSVVWAVELGLYYCVGEQYGSPWTRFSFLQLLGFVFLFLGTLLYNDVVKMPGVGKALPHRELQATWSPTVNRAANWGKGEDFGPQSPPGMSPLSSPASPLAWPFGRSPTPDLQNPLLNGQRRPSFTMEDGDEDIGTLDAKLAVSATK